MSSPSGDPQTAPAPTGWPRFSRVFLGSPGAHQHLGALDGLRGLAVLIVIASHLSYRGLGLVPGLGLAGVGKSGVYLFFVLSAFLLTRALLQRPFASLGSGRLWANYSLRRVLRIWPLYLVVLLLSWGLTSAGVEGWHYQLDDAALVRHLSLREGQSVLWSIPVEFKFYVWLPLLAAALAWAMQRGWSLTAEAALMVALLAGATWIWPPGEAASNDVRLGPYLVVFLCGAFAARFDHRLRALPRVLPRSLWVVIGLLGLLGWVSTIPEVWSGLTGAPLDIRVNHRWFLFFGLAWSCLLLAILHGPVWLRALFESAPVRLVGIVSFSAYLWHMPVLSGLYAVGADRWPLAPWLLLLAVLAVAMASYVLFERPWRDWRLPSARERPGSAADVRISHRAPRR